MELSQVVFVVICYYRSPSPTLPTCCFYNGGKPEIYKENHILKQAGSIRLTGYLTGAYDLTRTIMHGIDDICVCCCSQILPGHLWLQVFVPVGKSAVGDGTKDLRVVPWKQSEVLHSG